MDRLTEAVLAVAMILVAPGCFCLGRLVERAKGRRKAKGLPMSMRTLNRLVPGKLDETGLSLEARKALTAWRGPDQPKPLLSGTEWLPRIIPIWTVCPLEGPPDRFTFLQRSEMPEALREQLDREGVRSVSPYMNLAAEA
jgi:hypothetical protein